MASPSKKQRAQGMPDARCVRSRACSVESTRVSHHGHTGNTRHSPRNGFNGFLRALPGDRALLPPSPAKLSFANLTPASGRQDHTTSPSASVPLVKLRIRVHRIPCRVDDVGQRPSVARDGASSKGDLPDGASGIFFAEGLDGQVADLPVGQEGLNGRADLPPQIAQSSPGLTGRSSIPETARWNRNAAAYWIPRMRG